MVMCEIICFSNITLYPFFCIKLHFKISTKLNYSSFFSVLTYLSKAKLGDKIKVHTIFTFLPYPHLKQILEAVQVSFRTQRKCTRIKFVC